MEDHRGKHRIKVFEKNRASVKKWLEDNPEKTMKDCSVDLGLSYLTARNHIKEILKEKPGN